MLCFFPFPPAPPTLVSVVWLFCFLGLNALLPVPAVPLCRSGFSFRCTLPFEETSRGDGSVPPRIDFFPCRSGPELEVSNALSPVIRLRSLSGHWLVSTDRLRQFKSYPSLFRTLPLAFSLWGILGVLTSVRATVL